MISVQPNRDPPKYEAGFHTVNMIGLIVVQKGITLLDYPGDFGFFDWAFWLFSKLRSETRMSGKVPAIASR
jgi:hypothetical protein